MPTLPWRFVDESGFPASNVPVLVYRANAIDSMRMGVDWRTGDGQLEKWRVSLCDTVIAWIPISALMETLP